MRRFYFPFRFLSLALHSASNPSRTRAREPHNLRALENIAAAAAARNRISNVNHAACNFS